MDKNRLAVSVFAGDSDAPFDEEGFNIWKNLGVAEKSIAKLPKKITGGGRRVKPGRAGRTRKCFIGRAMPIKFRKDLTMIMICGWKFGMMFLCNLTRKLTGLLETLKQQNVDTGMGLERTLSALNGFNDDYRTELFGR